MARRLSAYRLVGLHRHYGLGIPPQAGLTKSAVEQGVPGIIPDPSKGTAPMRPDLRLAFEESDRRAAIGTQQPPLRIHPYLAVYAVTLSPDDAGHASAVLIERFEFHEAADALDLAENLSHDPIALASVGTETRPDAIVVNDHAGNELARFHLGRVQVVQAQKKPTPWLWRMLGWN